jgi:hypothetical protein
MIDRKVIVLSFCLAALAAPAATLAGSPQPTWHSVHPMSTPRADHQAVLLTDGRVLVMGGVAGDTASVAINSAEIYVPETDAWIRLPDMNASRTEFAAVRLADGRVLATGGRGGLSGAQASSEIFDPATGYWTPTADMSMPRTGHTAVLL